jgi:hypothetical protein
MLNASCEHFGFLEHGEQVALNPYLYQNYIYGGDSQWPLFTGGPPVVNKIVWTKFIF